LPITHAALTPATRRASAEALSRSERRQRRQAAL
jgi:hypothetical protein